MIVRSLLAVVATLVWAAPGAPAVQAREVTGSLTLNGAPIPMVHAYAFATRTRTGEEDATLLFFTSAPLTDAFLRELVVDPGIINRSKLAALVMQSPLTAIDVYMRPSAVAEARTGATAQGAMSSTFYAKVFASDDGYVSYAGPERLTLVTSDPGTIAGTVRIASYKFSPSIGGGATVEYNLTFKTKLRTPGK